MNIQHTRPSDQALSRANIDTAIRRYERLMQPDQPYSCSQLYSMAINGFNGQPNQWLELLEDLKLFAFLGDALSVSMADGWLRLNWDPYRASSLKVSYLVSPVPATART